MKRFALLALALGTWSGCNSPTTPSPAQIPNIQGQWRGTYVVQSCSETGSSIGVACRTLGSGSGGLTLTLTQSGTSVQGTLGIGAINVQVSGSVDANGVLTLAGQGTVTTGTTINLNTWRTSASGSAMSGTFTFTVLAGPPAVSQVGSVTVGAALQGVTKT